MYFGHDRTPELFGNVSFITFTKLGVVVITGPGGGRVIRGITGKPDIIVIRGGTGFTSDCHISKVNRASGTLCHHIHHGTGKKPCGSFLNNLPGIRFRIV